MSLGPFQLCCGTFDLKIRFICGNPIYFDKYFMSKFAEMLHGPDEAGHQVLAQLPVLEIRISGG